MCAVVDLPPFASKVCLVTVHLPHSGRPLSDLLAALSSLEDCLKPFARTGHPIFLLGDLNVDLNRAESDRHVALRGFLCAMGLDSFL